VRGLVCTRGNKGGVTAKLLQGQCLACLFRVVTMLCRQNCRQTCGHHHCQQRGAQDRRSKAVPNYQLTLFCSTKSTVGTQCVRSFQIGYVLQREKYQKHFFLLLIHFFSIHPPQKKIARTIKSRAFVRYPISVMLTPMHGLVAAAVHQGYHTAGEIGDKISCSREHVEFALVDLLRSEHVRRLQPEINYFELRGVPTRPTETLRTRCLATKAGRRSKLRKTLRSLRFAAPKQRRRRSSRHT
jgi:hypothetical protein